MSGDRMIKRPSGLLVPPREEFLVPIAGGMPLYTPGGGVTDHGALTGLTDDDHAAYLLATEQPNFRGWHLLRTNDITVANVTYTAIVWEVEHKDTDGFWSSGSTVTIPAGMGGEYLLIAHGGTVANSTGPRLINIQKNDADPTPFEYASVAPATTTTLAFSRVARMSLVAGDTTRVRIRQDSGGDLVAPAGYLQFIGIRLGA